jgi:hypothetical protein
MPSWRAAFIAMADAYAPLGGVAPLLAQLHDPALSERQALAAIRRYVDGVHARRHEYGSDAGSEAEVSETSEVSGSESEGEDGPVYGIAL